MHSNSAYEIWLIPQQLAGYPGGHWLNLAVVAGLSRCDGVFTNEARSATSVLLSWV